MQVNSLPEATAAADVAGPVSAADGSVSEQWARVAAFASAVDAALDKWLAQNSRVGLTEFRALRLIARESSKELRVTELANKVGLNQSSATRLVSRLEAKGLARRDVCEADGRGVYAVISDEGEELVHQLRAAYDTYLRELLGGAEARTVRLDVAGLRHDLTSISALLGTKKN